MILKKQHKPKCNIRYYVRVQTLKVCEVLALFSTLTIKTMEFNSIIVLFHKLQRLWSKHNRMPKSSNKFYVLPLFFFLIFEKRIRNDFSQFVVSVKRIFKIYMFEIIRTAGVSWKFVSFKLKSAFVCN